MGMLYIALLTALSPVPLQPGEELDDWVSRVDLLRIKKREAQKFEPRIKEARQFSLRVELNRALNELKNEIERLHQ